jgi:galactose mutarotase-like enzyme
MTTHPVTIENDAIRMDVWPTLGGKVSSIVDKADKFELLFNYPCEIPTSALYDAPYQSGWYGGWDECFPAVAAGPYTGHPYNAVNIPDHGELWGIPTVAVPTKDGITTVWNGLRFGYRLTRKLALEDASIVARYTLVNLAPFPFRFVWAQHALLALTQPVHIQLPPKAPMRLSHDARGRVLDRNFSWPALGDGEDFSKPIELPAQSGWKIFSADAINGAAVVSYPSRSRRLEIAFSSEDGIPTYWGIWIDNGGWARHRHFALEPTTGRFDQLDRAVNDDSAGKVAASAQVTWNVTWRLR